MRCFRPSVPFMKIRRGGPMWPPLGSPPAGELSSRKARLRGGLCRPPHTAHPPSSPPAAVPPPPQGGRLFVGRALPRRPISPSVWPSASLPTPFVSLRSTFPYSLCRCATSPLDKGSRPPDRGNRSPSSEGGFFCGPMRTSAPTGDNGPGSPKGPPHWPVSPLTNGKNLI